MRIRLSIMLDAADSDYQAGEATGTTKAQQDSDEDAAAADTGHCTSPRQRAPQRPSSAGVHAGGSDRTCAPPKASPGGKLEDKGSAKPSKVGSSYVQ